MSYERKRQIFFAVLGIIITLTWSPLRANGGDVTVFIVVLIMIIGGYWGIERLLGPAPKDD